MLERDHLDAPAQRLGVLQGRHVHGLLAGGQRALETIFPGFTDAIVEAGAAPVRANAGFRFEPPGHDTYPQRDFGWVRSLSFLDLDRVHLPASGSLPPASNFGPAPVRRLGERGWRDHAGRPCRGRRQAWPSASPLDLIVDATGRGHPTLDLLKALGWPPASRR